MRALGGLLLVPLMMAGSVEARPAHHRHGAFASDSERTLARMAARDRLAVWPEWEEGRPLESHLPPATRERIAAPPFTGWGYGTTIPGAWPGF